MFEFELRDGTASVLVLLTAVALSGCNQALPAAKENTANGNAGKETAQKDKVKVDKDTVQPGGAIALNETNAADSTAKSSDNRKAPATGAKKPGQAERGKRAGTGKKAGGGRGFGGPREPVPTPAEAAVIELAQRLGGSAKRPVGGGPPGPLSIIDLPGQGASNEDLKIVAQLPTIYTLQITGPGFSDAGVATVASMPGIVSLHLTGDSFSDEGIAMLAGHRSLQILILEKVNLGTAGLSALAKNESLESVDLVDIPITPEILEGLKQMRLAREIRLIRTGISEADRAALTERLPDCDWVIEQ